MNTLTYEQVLQDLADLLRNFNGREYSGDIGPQTRFFGDLGMMSIDAVVLGETLEQQYGRRFPFPQFLAGLAARGAEDLAIGELAEFLWQQLANPIFPPSPLYSGERGRG
jgi:acyl carrier protein